MRTLEHRLFAMVLATIILTPAVITAKPSIWKFEPPPPGRNQLEELWQVTLNNPDRDTYAVWMEGTITEATKGQVFWAKTKEFRLPPGTMVLRYADIQRIGIERQTHAPGYEQFAARSGGLPEGDYTFLLKLMPGYGEKPYPFPVRRPGAPRLISPRDGDTITARNPQFIWTPPSPMPRGRVTYELKIVQMLPGQSAEEAMRANPSWFEQKGITATSLTYPTSARQWPDSGHWCWQVAAQGPNGGPAGKSVIGGFCMMPSGGGGNASNSVCGYVRRGGDNKAIGGATVVVRLHPTNVDVGSIGSAADGYYSVLCDHLPAFTWVSITAWAPGYEPRVVYHQAPGQYDLTLRSSHLYYEGDSAELIHQQFYLADRDNLIPNPGFEQMQFGTAKHWFTCEEDPGWCWPQTGAPQYISSPDYLGFPAWGVSEGHQQSHRPMLRCVGLEAFPRSNWTQEYADGWHGEVLRARLVSEGDIPLGSLSPGSYSFSCAACSPSNYVDPRGTSVDCSNTNFRLWVYIRPSSNDGLGPARLVKLVPVPATNGQWMTLTQSFSLPEPSATNPVIEIRLDIANNNSSPPRGLLLDDLRLVKNP